MKNNYSFLHYDIVMCIIFMMISCLYNYLYNNDNHNNEITLKVMILIRTITTLHLILIIINNNKLFNYNKLIQ